MSQQHINEFNDFVLLNQRRIGIQENSRKKIEQTFIFKSETIFFAYHQKDDCVHNVLERLLDFFGIDSQYTHRELSCVM